MKKMKKVFVALLLVLSTLVLSSCTLPIGLVMAAFELRMEEERQNSKMDAEIVGEVSFTVEEEVSDRFSVDATFYIKNNGEYDCDDWELAVYFYDEEDCLIYCHTVADYSWEYDSVICPQVLKKGETSEIQVLDCRMPYRPVRAEVKDVALYHVNSLGLGG